MSYYIFKDYDLSHLDTISLSYFHPDKQININIKVDFSFHCFTKDLYYYEKNVKHRRTDIIEENLIKHINEIREFDFLRYEQSKLLPRLIQNLFQNGTNICFYTNKVNKGKEVYFRKETIVYNGITYEYYIFFNITKQKQILFYVTSAYNRDDNYYTRFNDSKIKLKTLINRLLK